MVNWVQDLFPEVGINLGVSILKYLAPVLVYFRNKSLKGADNNVVIGELMRDRLLSLGVDNEKITIIHNWSVIEDIEPVSRIDNHLRKE